MSILFVCSGNNERSNMAEELYNKMKGSRVSRSAGTRTSDSPRTDEVIQLLAKEGIDISSKPKTQLTEEMVDTADHIYVLCSKEKCPDYLLESEKAEFWDIPNPWGKDYNFLLKTKELIVSHLKTI